MNHLLKLEGPVEGSLLPGPLKAAQHPTVPCPEPWTKSTSQPLHRSCGPSTSSLEQTQSSCLPSQREGTVKKEVWRHAFGPKVQE